MKILLASTASPLFSLPRPVTLRAAVGRLSLLDLGLAQLEAAWFPQLLAHVWSSLVLAAKGPRSSKPEPCAGGLFTARLLPSLRAPLEGQSRRVVASQAWVGARTGTPREGAGMGSPSPTPARCSRLFLVTGVSFSRTQWALVFCSDSYILLFHGLLFGRREPLAHRTWS